MHGTDLPGSIPVLDDIYDAARRVTPVVFRTPLLESSVLNERVGGRVLLKAECLQISGSFKFRGAFNRLSRIVAKSGRPPCVVAWSSGNHAQGVAAAAHLLGVRAVIVMPKDAPKTKIEGTKSLGAEIVFYDRYTEDREEIGHALATELNATLVPSYDDPMIIAGQGSLALEMVDQARDCGARFDSFLVCCGGGGLTAGCALALEAVSPRTEIYLVEPNAFDDTARSIAAGERLSADPRARSICDALLTATPGRLTFPINRRLVKGGLAVSDREAARAMGFAFRHLKVVVEPGGAVALAATLAEKFDCRGKTVGVVLSGGNVDAELFSQALQDPDYFSDQPPAPPSI